MFAFTSAVLCEPLLLALGQPADVAYTSAHYAQVQSLGSRESYPNNLLQPAHKEEKSTKNYNYICGRGQQVINKSSFFGKHTCPGVFSFIQGGRTYNSGAG